MSTVPANTYLRDDFIVETAGMMLDRLGGDARVRVTETTMRRASMHDREKLCFEVARRGIIVHFDPEHDDWVFSAPSDEPHLMATTASAIAEIMRP